MHILIATDGSVQSDLAVRLGARLVHGANKPPTILTIIKHETERSQADAILARAVRIMSPEIANVQTCVRVGHAAEEIIHEAQANSCDLIIVGTWLKQNLATRFLAPTTERVMMQSPCPVLITKGKVNSIRRVLLCTSGADTPSRLNHFATRLATLLDGDIEMTVLHVMSQISVSPGIREAWQLHANAEELIQEHTPEGELLQQDIQILEQSGARIQPQIRHGLVVEEILAEALNGDYDLVVIGAHRRTGWRRFLLDDLMHQIVTQIDRPIVIV